LEQHIECRHDVIVMSGQVRSTFAQSLGRNRGDQVGGDDQFSPVDLDNGMEFAGWSFRIGGGAIAIGRSGTTIRVLKWSSMSD
jgi:hypothetical protein